MSIWKTFDLKYGLYTITVSLKEDSDELDWYWEVCVQDNMGRIIMDGVFADDAGHALEEALAFIHSLEE